MRVNEKFLSVQGEGLDAGRLCAFVRFTACNIRCGYCDTEYAFYEGADESQDDIVAWLDEGGVDLCCLTGGEPMLQPDIPELMERLLAKGYRVLLETNGVIPLGRVPEAVVRIVDIKTPGALRRPESPADFATSRRFLKSHFHYPNLELLRPHDEVKFVLCDRGDYEWALAFVAEHRLADRVGTVLFSPTHPGLPPSDLVAWMRDDRAPARLNLQLHKVIWGTEVRGV
ncbi:MAG: 7-carboxy-7-deazaguanine synthase QueE [Myxococcota bacterium]